MVATRFDHEVYWSPKFKIATPNCTLRQIAPNRARTKNILFSLGVGNATIWRDVVKYIAHSMCIVFRLPCTLSLN